MLPDQQPHLQSDECVVPGSREGAHCRAPAEPSQMAAGLRKTPSRPQVRAPASRTMGRGTVRGALLGPRSPTAYLPSPSKRVTVQGWP